MNEFLTDKHKLYRLAFAESNVDRKWDRVIIFSDESTFSSANDGPVLVYRPRGERYNCQYMSTCTRSGRVSVLCRGWISHDGAAMLHLIDGHVDSIRCKHILQNVMGPSIRMLYRDGIIHFQQDDYAIHDSLVVQEWLSLQADFELTDWPPRAPGMNSIDYAE